ncbi:MAG: AAA family ATPase [Lachnospiraceae bacterium]|nr:AAA family ATPase [Lachnospiraceae bacterium]
MGIYFNPGKTAFEEAVNSEIFVDKTEMIRYLNSVIKTEQKYVCVSRPRRFGKSMAAKMLCAYYDREADSRSLFEKCKISKSAGEESAPEWDKYLGEFDVIRLVMTEFMQDSVSIDDMLDYLSEEVISELKEIYPGVRYGNRVNLRTVMNKIYGSKKTQFVIIIDEWDAIFREYKEDKEGQKKYLDFLRDWLKDKEYIALAYMTGILPIKKYGKHSALNMFTEYSMIQPRQLAPYVGFTSIEVEDKCKEKKLDYSGFKSWYDGYRLSNRASDEMILEGESVDDTVYREYDIYSPYSVVNAMLSKQFENYWNQTETYEALQQYIDWNFEGLKEDVAVLMEGGKIPVDITGYQNDMTTFHSKDDILTMLIHLGYLGYESDTKEVFIPNKEVLDVFKSSTKNNRDWTVTFRALQNSRKLLEATWNCDRKMVAELLEAAHDKAGNRTYHSEAGLSYAVQLAYYAAQDLYTIIPELDTGKGYADLAYIPKDPKYPAMLIELKYEKDADTAISQIHRQNYPERLELYKGNLILVGINYDRTLSNDSEEFKHHSCEIEKAV